MESAEELASLNLGSDYAMQSTVVPQAEALAAGVPTPFNTGLPVQTPPRPEGYYPGYTSRAYQEDNDSFLTKVGMVLMAGGTKPGEVPAPFKMKMMQNELALKRSEEERGWQNFHQTQQVADETMKLHNREAMSMGLKMLPQFKGMIHMQRDPEKRQAMTDHLKTMLESYAPGLGKVLDTMNTNPEHVLGADYMFKHPVYGKSLQDLADNRSYEELVADPQFKKMSDVIGRDLLTETISRFTIAEHEKMLSGKMTQPEFEKAFKVAVLDESFGPPNPDRIALAESMINTDSGEEIMAGNRVKTNKGALKAQEKSKELSYIDQQKNAEAAQIDAQLEEAQTPEGKKKYRPEYVKELQDRRDIYRGQKSKESTPGYNPQNRVNQRFKDLVDRAGIAGLPQTPGEIPTMEEGPLKTKAIELQHRASVENDKANADAAMAAKLGAPEDMAKGNFYEVDPKTNRFKRVTKPMTVGQRKQNPNLYELDEKQQAKVAEMDFVGPAGNDLFDKADAAYGKSKTMWDRGNDWKNEKLLGNDWTAWTAAGASEDLKTYLDARGAALGKFARSLGGEVGVLTDQDILRVVKMFPSASDTAKTRERKRSMFNKLVGLNRTSYADVITGKMSQEDFNALKFDKNIQAKVNGILGDAESYANIDRKEAEAAASKSGQIGGAHDSLPSAPAPKAVPAAETAFDRIKKKLEGK